MGGDAQGSKLHEIYHTGLRNLHALEMTAIELTERQTNRLENYPRDEAKLQEQHAESEEQARRLGDILNRHSTSTSGLKNAVTAVMGNVAAALHAPAPDEVLKSILANFASEHQEIAAYTSLIAMAESVGDTAAIPLLQRPLAEEERMAKWIRDQIVPTIERFMQLT